MSTKSLTKLLEKNLGPMTFGGFLRAARTNKDLTQVEMAKFLKISKSTLCDIEKGRQVVSIELAAKIAKRCGLSVALAVESSIRDHLSRSKLKLDIQVLEAA
jgi:DNA-binding XRE family transcriptional regulator